MARTIDAREWLVPVLCAALASTPASVDVSPVTSMGTPVMVMPQFQETGAPTFTSPNGSTTFSGSAGSTGSTASDPTTSDPTSSSGSGSGSVATNYSQYLNQNGIRTIAWTSTTSSSAANNGSAFYVVSHAAKVLAVFGLLTNATAAQAAVECPLSSQGHRLTTFSLFGGDPAKHVELAPGSAPGPNGSYVNTLPLRFRSGWWRRAASRVRRSS